MPIVRINAIEVPEGMGEVLEQRFAAAGGNVATAPGFLGFELLRPTGENEKRYFVVTHWESVEAFDNWVNSENFARSHAAPADTPAQGGHPHGGHGEGHPHGGGHPQGGPAGPVGTANEILEFDVAVRVDPAS